MLRSLGAQIACRDGGFQVNKGTCDDSPSKCSWYAVLSTQFGKRSQQVRGPFLVAATVMMGILMCASLPEIAEPLLG